MAPQIDVARQALICAAVDVQGETLAAAATAGDRVLGRSDNGAGIDVSLALISEEPSNAMSVDVEEHFQVSAFEDRIRRKEWASHPSRVARNIDRLLEMFDDAGAKATFFTLGCVAERHPHVVRSIVANGHEIASHGYSHHRVRNQSPAEYEEDVTRTRGLLEDLSGTRVRGYRAPSFSIGEDTPWAYDILQAAGYTYSSSVYPIRHDHYGSTSLSRFPFLVKPGGMLEIPLTTARVFGRNLPCAGGGYFRLLPVSYSLWAIRRVNAVERMPATFYMHPWEIDPGQPRVPGLSAKTRFRHYVNLSRFESRLEQTLLRFNWNRMDSVYKNALPGD
ncbi:MAG TPA: DUF3473 domain-containing protein [Woeseiaceae bacterium]|nr:DUF3473 domain-containing protein [Woeseiaceae bacterium]